MANDSMLPKVLIVNDHAPTLFAFEAVLTGQKTERPYDVFCADSGEAALRLVLAHHFAAILLDVSMPGMDGFETAELIHSRPSSNDTPIIFLTAHYENEVHRMRGYRLGAVDFLITPVVPDLLRAKVAVFVELEKRTLELQSKTQELRELNESLQVERLRTLQGQNALLQAEIKERRLAEQEAYRLATRDVLTGLLNRRLLMEELEHAVGEAKRRQDTLAVLFLDLDRFKTINDTLGHETGDTLLIEAGRRIQGSLRKIDLVARFGGDEFVVLIKNAGDRPLPHVEKVVAKIESAIASPVHVGDQVLATTASIGAAVYPLDGGSPAELLRHADAAMYEAKRASRSRRDR